MIRSKCRVDTKAYLGSGMMIREWTDCPTKLVSGRLYFSTPYSTGSARPQPVLAIMLMLVHAKHFPSLLCEIEPEAHQNDSRLNKWIKQYLFRTHTTKGMLLFHSSGSVRHLPSHMTHSAEPSKPINPDPTPTHCTANHWSAHPAPESTHSTSRF
jgi:hypothetical protein